jgi:hypothetical protein|tara:strand:- start:7 stop:231 length:225 start_codon:yes stop_codon:yes gene_type:complete
MATSLTEQETSDNGSPILFQLEVDAESLDELFFEYGIVPCHLHRNLLVDRLTESAMKWIRDNVEELSEEMNNNN